MTVSRLCRKRRSKTIFSLYISLPRRAAVYISACLRRVSPRGGKRRKMSRQDLVNALCEENNL